ncbi:virion structural protein [Pseudomonas phage Koomba boorn-mokiny kep-wari Wadjak 1]|nr:virion structural protein [Pseudomonas phage Koomba boorn-mokiny kep-wari Wadjak 1]
MASSGDMTDKLPSAMITALGGPVQQGRNIEMQDVTWEVSIPTIEECTEYLLTFFCSRVKRTQRPLISIRLADSYKILSSTVSTNNPSNLLAIDSDGKVVETTVTANCYIYLILKPVLKS